MIFIGEWHVFELCTLTFALYNYVTFPLGDAFLKTL